MMKLLNYRGISLVELMISVVLSSFLLLLLLGFQQQIKQQNRSILLQLQLQQETHRLLQLMAKDLKRAGFRAVNDRVLSSPLGDNFGLFEQPQTRKSIVISHSESKVISDCVLFFYDLNADGCLGKQRAGNCRNPHSNNTSDIREELFGYRSRNGQLQTWLTYKNALKNRCSLPECQGYLQQHCQQNNGWVGLLDEQLYQLRVLSFAWLGQQGIAIRLDLALRNIPDRVYQGEILVPLLNE